jgi:glucose-1-phosphate thymidylyltransferase
MQYLIDNNIQQKGEFWLTDAMENMKKKGSKFYKGEVQEWLDCGNKDATVYTNKRVLEIHKDTKMVATSVKNENSIVVQPCFIGDNVELKNSVVGPHASIGANSKIENSVITSSIIQTNCRIKNAVIDNSMIGNFAQYIRKPEDISMSDYSTHN